MIYEVVDSCGEEVDVFQAVGIFSYEQGKGFATSGSLRNKLWLWW